MSRATNPADSWREAFRILNQCPICTEAYDLKAAKVFAKDGAASLVHITCRGCKSYFVAMIIVVGQGLSSVGMVTDLNFDDAKRLYQVQPITTDEILQGHEYLDKNIFLHSLILNG